MITRDDWLKALHAADEPIESDTDVLTLREFAALLGVGLSAAMRRRDKLIAAGAAAHTTKRYRRIDGGVIRIPAVRLLKKDSSHDAPADRSAAE